MIFNSTHDAATGDPNPSIMYTIYTVVGRVIEGTLAPDRCIFIF